MASVAISKANPRWVLFKFAAAKEIGNYWILGFNRWQKYYESTGEETHWMGELSGRNASNIGHRTGSRSFSSRSPSLSLWRGKKSMGREGLLVIQELKRFKQDNKRLENFMKTNVARLLKSDLLAVLAEFQRQDEVFLALKIFDAVRQEIWYRSDMFFYRDMLIMLARNKKREDAMRVWEDMKAENIHLDQHTYADIIRAFLEHESPSEAMNIYEEMRQSPDPPLELPYRVIMKGLLPYPLLRNKVKQDFQELFPDIHVYDPPEDMFDHDES